MSRIGWKLPSCSAPYKAPRKTNELWGTGIRPTPQFEDTEARLTTYLSILPKRFQKGLFNFVRVDLNDAALGRN